MEKTIDNFINSVLFINNDNNSIGISEQRKEFLTKCEEYKKIFFGDLTLFGFVTLSSWNSFMYFLTDYYIGSLKEVFDNSGQVSSLQDIQEKIIVPLFSNDFGLIPLINISNTIDTLRKDWNGFVIQDLDNFHIDNFWSFTQELLDNKGIDTLVFSISNSILIYIDLIESCYFKLAGELKISLK